jgi:thiamine-monophosphate kinase
MFEDRTRRTELSQLGEFGLIDLLAKKISLQNSSSKYGIGDDCAVLDSEGKRILVTTDLLAEGIHFDMTYTPLKHLGYKAVAVNLSDVAAMNAIPKQITVSLALSNRFSVEAIEALQEGMLLACQRYGVDIVGGDTTSSQKGLVISITAIGYADENDIVYRNGARENDLICVSGDLGAAYVGLLNLKQEKSAFMANPEMQPELEGKEYLLERQLKPEPRLDIVHSLKDKKVKPSSMIDVSDGLASELKHICKQSKVGCTIYEEKIPIFQQTWDVARTFNLDPTTCALNGGEDYELLFTISQADYDKIKDDNDIAVIGHITQESEGLNLITKNGVSSPIHAQGWDGLKEEEE